MIGFAINNCGPGASDISSDNGSRQQQTERDDPDADIPLACDNPTGRDYVGRNRHALQGEGLRFDSVTGLR
jgi:hypothetical protein